VAAAVGLALGASAARAQQPAPAPLPAPAPVPAPAATQGQPVLIQGTILYANPPAPPGTLAPAPCASCGAADGAGVEGGAARRGWMPHYLRDWWGNHERCGCWAHFNGYSCSSLASEYAFIFGSCRTWYGEPCAKGPPPPAYPGEPPLKNKCPNCVVP
jgi:hypothetical protein